MEIGVGIQCFQFVQQTKSVFYLLRSRGKCSTREFKNSGKAGFHFSSVAFGNLELQIVMLFFLQASIYSRYGWNHNPK